jgi:hypothetical protein
MYRGALTMFLSTLFWNRCIMSVLLWKVIILHNQGQGKNKLKIHTVFFWVLTPWSLVDGSRRFGGTRCLHHQPRRVRSSAVSSARSSHINQTARRYVPEDLQNLFAIFLDVTHCRLVVSSWRWTVWPLKMGPKDRPETSVTTNLLCLTSHKSGDLTPWMKPEITYLQNGV